MIPVLLYRSVLVHAVTVISNAFDGGYLHPVAQPSLPVGGSPLTLFVPSSKVGLQSGFDVLQHHATVLTGETCSD